MGRTAAASWQPLLLLLLLRLLPLAVAHYNRLPCLADETQAEVQGGSGYFCAPRCDASNYNCPLDTPQGSNAAPQCMLQDVNRGAFCGLLCQVDIQCPSGARCQQLKQFDVGICLFTLSFTDWARQGSVKKLAIGWPSQAGGRPAAGFQISKTYMALQNMKVKYSIDDGDADMLTLKELLAALSATSTPRPGALALPQSPAMPQGGGGGGGGGGGLLSPWAHDVRQFEKYMSRGIPGIEEEIGDTIWNVEHITNYGTATMLLRGLILLGLAYLGLGSFIKYQAVGARGLDMLPHIGFWMDYPNLVADGVTYAKILVGVNAGTSKGTSAAGPDLAGGVRSGSGAFDPL